MKSRRKLRRPTATRISEGEESPKGVDGGWAWMVCLGSHISQMLSLGFLSSLGVFYIEWKEYFDSSATASSWLVSVPWLVASPLSPFSGILASHVFGLRRMAIIGAVIQGLATILGSFATDMWQLYLSCAMSGLVVVMTVPSGFIMLTQYFKKRFALANGLSLVGVSVGQMFFPPLTRLLIANYGWRGALFIIGAVQMNSVAACALFRPLKITPKKDTLGEGNLEMEALHNHIADAEIETASEPQQRQKQSQSKIIQEILAFLKLLTNVPLILTLAVISTFAMAYMINVVHLPARSKEAGWSDDQNAVLLSIFAAVSIVTRLGHGWFVDRNFIGLFKLQFISLLASSLVSFLNPVSDSYVFLVGYTAVLGAFLGITAPLMLVIAKQLVKASDIPSAVSLVVATFCFFNGIGSVIAGKMYDDTGSYVVTFLVGGALFLVSFLLLFAVVVLKGRQERNIKLKLSQGEHNDNALAERV